MSNRETSAQSPQPNSLYSHAKFVFYAKIMSIGVERTILTLLQ